MNRRTGAAVLTGVVLMGVVLSMAGPAAASASAVSKGDAGPPRRVLVVTAPRLTWETVDRLRPPNLMRFFDRSALASTSVRSAKSVTSLVDGYVTLGAGNRAAAPSSLSTEVVDRRDPDVATQRAVFERQAGVKARGDAFTLSLPPIVALNVSQHYGAVPGSLGKALGRQGVAAVGNATSDLTGRSGRDVAFAAIDADGRLAHGDVGADLLAFDPVAPAGLVLDADRVVAAVEQAFGRASIVFAELGDLERAEQARAASTPQQGSRQFDDAVARSDELFGRLLGTVDLSRDLVIVVAPAAPLAREQLTVFAMAGPAVKRGWASSSTTRRGRFTTLTDIAPDIVSEFQKVPAAMTDTRLTSSADSSSTADRLDRLVDDNLRAVHRDSAFGPFTVVFVIGIVLMLGFAALHQARGGEAVATTVRLGAMWILGILPWTYLVGLFPLGSISPAGQGFLVAALGLLTGLVVEVLTRRFAPQIPPPAVLAVASVLVPAVDIVTGGRLQLSTIFGYSPIVAGRFAGFGNQVFSVFAISLLLVVTAFAEPHLERVVRGSRSDGDGVGEGDGEQEETALVAPWRVVAVAVAAFVAALVLDGHPAFGSDVGGVLALVPTFTVATLMLRGIRIRVRTVLLAGGLALLALGVFTLVDLARPAAERTHLGRFAQQILDGDLLEVLQRKLSANLRVLVVVWTWVIPAALVYLAYLSWRPNRALTQIRRRHPGFRIFGVSGLLLGALSMAVNDSGVSMPAMMLAVALSYTAHLAVSLDATARDP